MMNLPKFLRRDKATLEEKRSYERHSFVHPELKANVEAVLAPIPPKSKGRVIKQTRHSEFNPNPVKGGRVVKIMPRNLQKIKAAQEMVEDDSVPKIEDLDD